MTVLVPVTWRTGIRMAYDRQNEDRFRRFQLRILELEKAAEAQDRAIKQLAEKIGVEVDLTRMPTPKETYAQEQAKKSNERSLEHKELMDLLGESGQDDAQ